MSDWYIDPAGNDGNVGTSAGPGNAWLTLYKAAQVSQNASLADGDIIHCAAGTYALEPNPTDIDKSVSIVGPFEGVDGNDGSRGTGEAELHIVQTTLNADNIVFDGVEITQQAVQNLMFQGSTASGNITGCRVRNNVFKEIGLAHDGYAVFLQCTGNGEPTITDLVVTRNKFDAIYYAGVITENSFAGDHFIDIEISDNTFTDIGLQDAATAIKLHGTSSAVISGNTFTNNERHINADAGILTVPPTISILNNTFDVSGPGAINDRYAILLGHSGNSGHLVAVIDGNTIDVTEIEPTGVPTPWYAVGIDGGDEVTITNNTINYTGVVPAAVHHALQLSCSNSPTRSLDAVTIQSNTIDGGAQGGPLTAAIGILTDGLVSGNSIQLRGDFLGNWYQGVFVGRVLQGFGTGSTMFLDDATASWIIDSFVGQLVLNLAAPGYTVVTPVGFVSSNSTNQMTFATPFHTWAPGDVYLVYYQPGQLPAGVDITIRAYFQDNLTYGVFAGFGTDIDARYSYWGNTAVIKTGPAGADPTGTPVTDPVTGRPADGNGVGITSDIRFWPYTKLSLPDKRTGHAG